MRDRIDEVATVDDGPNDRLVKNTDGDVAISSTRPGLQPGADTTDKSAEEGRESGARPTLGAELAQQTTLQRSPHNVDPEERSDTDRDFLREVGTKLVTKLFSACKTIRLYNNENRASRRALAELETEATRVIAREGHACVRVAGAFIHINDIRLSVEPQLYGPFEFISGEMTRRQVESITFRPGTDASELGRFLRAFFDVDPVESAFDVLQVALADSAVHNIEVSRLEERELELTESPDDDQLKLRSNQVYFRTVALVGDILRTIEEKNILHVRKAKRLTQQMVDILQTDESMLVGLASIKNFDAYTFMHSVNVCILSMLIGDRFRFDRTDVARLGVAALFHDIGKTYIPSSILNSSRDLTPREWELMKYHTFFGVKELSRVRALRDAAESMFVALQHHVHLNNNGYPQRPGGWNLRLFSRIVTVADYYDAMTASRSYQKVPVTPDKALRFILEKSGEIFDPFVAKVFIRAMGLYPIGTIVELQSGERAIVVRQNPDSKYIHRPVVEIVDESSDPMADREMVDLTERRGGEYRFRRSIRRAIHDSEIDVDKRRFFVQS